MFLFVFVFCWEEIIQKYVKDMDLKMDLTQKNPDHIKIIKFCQGLKFAFFLIDIAVARAKNFKKP